MPRLVLIDSNSLLHRAYHALPPLTTGRGEPVGAVFGFTSMFLKVIEELKPDFVAAAWDTAKPTFRHQKYTQYKEHRPEMPEDLLQQEGRVKEVLKAFNIPQFWVEGYEADDIIGSLTVQATQSTIETIIITGDLDALQLVNEHVKVFTSKKGFSDTILYGVEEVKKRYGLKPSQLVDYRALRGDPSDNIPGVKGVGEKTAIKLLQQFKTLTAIYQQLDKIDARWAKLLRQDEESAFLSQDLARIRLDVPIRLELTECHLQDYEREQVLKLFQELGFRSLINRLPQLSTKSEKSSREKPSDQLIQSEQDWLRLQQELRKTDTVALDVETNGLDPLSAELVGVALATAPDRAWFLPTVSALVKPVQRALLGKKVVAHNLKFDAHIVSRYGVDITQSKSLFDTMLAAHLLQEGQGRVGLKELAFNRLGKVIPTFDEVAAATVRQKQGFDWTQIPLETLANYACTDADITFQLYQQFKKELDNPQNEKLSRLFYEVEMPLVPILLQMEKTGILVDKVYLSTLSSQLTDSIAKLAEEVYQAVGYEFNLNSPKQLEEVLFDQLKLPAVKKTKTQRSTDESVLLKLRRLHPVIEPLLEYREAFKIKSTYLDTLLAQLDSQNRVHTQFNQARTATGRLSSENPNLQNIPVESAVNVRRAFIAAPGHKLLVADYSQIELRIMAHFSQDKNLLESFVNNQDIHAATAARIFDKFITEITPQERRAAKTINFGILYGLSAHGLSEALQIEYIKAAEYIDDYFESYRGVRLWIEENLAQARELGFVETLLGRRRRLPDLTSGNFVRRAAAERMAVNMPIQGTAADLIKLAMASLAQGSRLKAQGTHLILQVHDELVFEVPQERVEGVGRLVRQEMENAFKLSVPVKVDLKVGESWGELKNLKS